MKKNIIIGCTMLIAITMLFSCVKKEVPLIVSSNKITISFVAGGKYAVTTNSLTAKPKDSIQLNYVISSTGKMKYIYLVKNDIASKVVVNGQAVGDTIKPNSDHYHLTTSKKLMLDSIPGNYSYQIVARDSGGVYVGSSDPILVTILTDYTYITNRTLYVPDTTDKNNPCYFNIASAKAFSYKDVSSGAVNSNQIDFGYYYDADTVLLKDGKTKAVKGHSIYNLNISPIPRWISMYDISGFTKNNTYLKKVTNTWASLNSGGAIKSALAAAIKASAITSNYISMNLDTNTPPVAAVATPVGTVIVFKTVDGKSGAFTVTFKNQDHPKRGTYIVIEEKILN